MLQNFLTVFAVILTHASVAGKWVKNPGEDFRFDCTVYSPTAVDPERYITQIYRNGTRVKQFTSTAWTDTLEVISNNTVMSESIANSTDRYNVTGSPIGGHSLIIKNLTDSDSSWYGCRIFDSQENRVTTDYLSTELFVPGPLDGLFWTSNYSRLSLDEAKAFRVPDGGTAIVSNKAFRSNVACAVLVSNVEPHVNISIGRFSDPGRQDVTSRFDTRIASTITDHDGGSRYRATVFFVKSISLSKNIEQLSCHATAGETVFESTIRLVVATKPPNQFCSPRTFYAPVGSENVELYCVIPAWPTPSIEWIISPSLRVSETSGHSGYTVRNQEVPEGLKTTLSIATVTLDDLSLTDIKIEATNSEGSGTSEVHFREGPLGTSRACPGNNRIHPIGFIFILMCIRMIML